MLNELAAIHGKGGSLLGVKYCLFERDPSFVTAVGLQFEKLSAVFRAVADNDTVAVNIGPLQDENGETLIDAGSSEPWSTCIGRNLRWAWQLTNQQGYVDGVRLEFRGAGESSNPVVELIVIASAMKMFVASPLKQALKVDSP